MTRRRVVRSIAVTAVALSTAAPADAQGLSGRVALEAVASASANAQTLDDPAVILDLVGTIRLADGWDVVVRPWSRRRPGGDWTFEMYQLQLRYVSSTRVPFRVDAGILSSPLGLAALELQPHRNPLVNAPFYYFSPLPRIDDQDEGLRLLSGGYPIGAMISTSGAKWDARAGVLDTTPMRGRGVLNDGDPDLAPQVVLGGGVTPLPGFRIGAGFAHGRFEPRGSSRPSLPSELPPHDSRRRATVFTLEGEYAFGHTRVSGEWIRDRFDAWSGRTSATGFNTQAVRTLSPRIFTAVRATRVSAPVATRPSIVSRASTEVEMTAGYRLTTEVTLRGGYQRARGYSDPAWRNAAVVSLVWAERWW